DRVGAPDDPVLTARKIHHLSQEVHRRHIGPPESARETVPGAAHFEVDVPQIVSLDDIDQLGAPRDVLRSGLGAFARSSTAGRGIPTRVVDDEVEISKIFGYLLDVLRMAVLFIEQAERQSFVDADILDAEFLA